MYTVVLTERNSGKSKTRRELKDMESMQDTQVGEVMIPMSLILFAFFTPGGLRFHDTGRARAERVALHGGHAFLWPDSQGGDLLFGMMFPLQVLRVSLQYTVV